MEIVPTKLEKVNRFLSLTRLILFDVAVRGFPWLVVDGVP